MIPVSAQLDESQLMVTQSPSYTYKLDLNSKRIVGMVDGRSAIAQAIYKILYTERYAYVIYNWDYGMELEQYLGESTEYVKADIQQSITEALLVDDRILRLENFIITQTKIDAISIEFLAITTEGHEEIIWEVPSSG